MVPSGTAAMLEEDEHGEYSHSIAFSPFFADSAPSHDLADSAKLCLH